MKAITYKGFQASVNYEDGALFIKVLHIDDLLIAEVDSAASVQEEFEILIDEYLADCEELGKEPAKPFKGSFNVRLTPETHRLVAMRAAGDGMSLNNWVSLAISEKLACTQLDKRLDGVLSNKKNAFVEALVLQAGTSTAHRIVHMKNLRRGWQASNEGP